MKIEILDVLSTTNFWLVSLGAAILTELLRRIMLKIKPSLEKNKACCIILPTLPFIFGPCLALIPGLTIAETLAQSIVLGLIAGAFSGATYPFIKRIIKLFMKQKETSVTTTDTTTDTTTTTSTTDTVSTTDESEK